MKDNNDMKLIRKEYRTDIITGKKVLLQVDKESDQHESHCFVFSIPFKNRTKYSCNCDQKKVYLENFLKLRNAKQS